MSHSMCPSMPISMKYSHEEGYWKAVLAILKMFQKKSTSLGRIMGRWQHIAPMANCIKFSNFVPILDTLIGTTSTFIVSDLSAAYWNKNTMNPYGYN